MNNNQWIKTGDYKLQHVNLWRENEDPINIRDLVMDIIIYESIRDYTLSGELIISDSHDLISTLPITGGEFVEVKFKTAGYSKFTTLKFVIYKISDRKQTSQNNQVYKLHLVTEDYYNDLNTQISWKFKGNHSSVIKNLLSQYINSSKSITAENSRSTAEYISPLYSGFENIIKVTKDAVGVDGSPYLFFETTQGYNFKSLGELYSAESKKDVLIEPKNAQTKMDQLDRHFRTAESIQQNESYDMMKLRKLDVFQTNINVFNRMSKNTSSTNAVFNDYPHIDKYRIKGDFDGNTQRFILSDDDEHKLYKHQRISMLNLLFLSSCCFGISGDSNLLVGDKISIKFPAIKTTSETLDYEKFTSGLYIITSIKHVIQKQSYYQYITISKDSYGSR